MLQWLVDAAASNAAVAAAVAEGTAAMANDDSIGVNTNIAPVAANGPVTFTVTSAATTSAATTSAAIPVSTSRPRTPSLVTGA